MSESKQTMRTFAPIADARKMTAESLQAFENKYSCQLPYDYREFLLSNNGAFPSPDCVTFEEAGRKTASDVFCLFAVVDDRPSLSMEWHQESFSNRLPKNTLPIGRDSCGNLWLIGLHGDNAGAIFFWDHGSYDTFDETDLTNWPKVASSFKEFLGNLNTDDASAETGGVPSRYSLVRQATDGMKRRDSGFSTMGNPGFVWHCNCNAEGNVQMQFVQYEAHAVATHTCGYSRLCAIKGLIKGGQPRLPE
ncbi:MAG: SMI1/KNR4 family protein [Planctomycetota bacterium]